MLRLLKILWPALIPLLGYLAYVAWRSRKRSRGEEMPPLRGVGFWCLVASLLVGIVCFVTLGIEQTSTHPKHYEPAHLNSDGSLTPGSIQ